MNQNMNFSQFCNELIRALTPMFPEQTSISIQTIPKNNNVSFEALIIHEPGTNISPTIYLEDYYTLYRDGTSLDELCEIICDVFLEVRLNHPIDPSFFTDFAQARQRLIFQVISYEKNEQRLQDLPHIQYLDLAVIFCCMLRMENGEAATVTIKNEHLALWDTNLETIKKQALANTPRLLPAYIQSITEVLRDLATEHPCILPLLKLSEHDPDIPKLYVLTNETQIGGASCMLYPHILSDFADSVGKDLYLLPSSIHEVLLLPTDIRHSEASLNALVRQVNEEQLPLTQQLSDHVYFYSRELKSICSCAQDNSRSYNCSYARADFFQE